MKINRRSRIVLILTALAATVLLTTTARAQNKSYWVIHEFQGGDRWCESCGCTGRGQEWRSLWRTTAGGTYDYGTVFKLDCATNSRRGLEGEHPL